jgi:hypothetical protein
MAKIRSRISASLGYGPTTKDTDKLIRIRRNVGWVGKPSHGENGVSNRFGIGITNSTRRIENKINRRSATTRCRQGNRCGSIDESNQGIPDVVGGFCSGKDKRNEPTYSTVASIELNWDGTGKTVLDRQGIAVNDASVNAASHICDDETKISDRLALGCVASSGPCGVLEGYRSIEIIDGIIGETSPSNRIDGRGAKGPDIDSRFGSGDVNLYVTTKNTVIGNVELKGLGYVRTITENDRLAVK